MARGAAGTTIAGCIFVIAIAVLVSLWPTAATPGAGQPSSVAVMALDADPRGNSPRTIGSIEQCVSATVGQPVDIDIILPSPGIPANRGVAAYQFTLFYDPSIVWIETDAATEMLLAQAPASSVLPIQDPKPDKNGVYMSWAVDFGPKGIEPGGASETGPGVVSRITLLPQSSGMSPLVLRDVVIIDNASQKITVDSIQSGTILVGEPCPGQSPPVTPSPPAVSPTPTAAPPPPAATAPTPAPPAPTSPAATPTPPAGAPVFVPTAGGAPPQAGGASWWPIVAGLGAALAGGALLMGRKVAFRANSLGKRRQ